MRPRKKGQQYEICYRCPGYTKPIYERFPTYEAANLRVAQIEYEKSIGEFRPPKQTPIQTKRAQKKFITVSELLDEYVQVYGLNHWGDSFLSCNLHRIEHYIKPYLGNVAVKDLTTHDLDLFYDSLQDKPAVVLKGHKKTDACVSRSVIEKTHALLRSALNQAVIWEYIPSNPALRVTLPKYQPQERTVWSASEAQQALDSCPDPVLKLCMLLALGCSMRVGEILGLTWDCVDISEDAICAGTAHVRITKELKRCQKDSLAALERRGRSTVLLTFPEWKQTGSSTSLVLKAPKTESSVRKVFLPKTVALALAEEKGRQQEIKEMLAGSYQDFDLVIAHEDGRPYEERQIAFLLRKLTDATGLPPVVFHSLRHPYVKHTTKIFSLRLMDFQAQAYPDARRKTRGACQLRRGGQSQSPVHPLCNRKRFSYLPPQSKISRILYAISMRLSGYTSTRSISSSASSVVSASASKIALDASFRLSCRACSSCFCFACANTAA